MPSVNDIGIIVGGRRVTEPGSYAEFDISAFNIPGGGLVKRGVIIASSKGGPPRELITLTSGNEAVNVLKAGEGLEAALLAYDPSGQIQGASEIGFYRINNAISASLDFGNLVMTAKPTHAGQFGNGFKGKRDLHPDGQSYLLFINDTHSGTLEESPPLGPALVITYLGVAVAPTVEVVAGTPKVLQLRGDNASEDHDIQIGIDGDGLPTFFDLQQFIDETSAWSAEILWEHFGYDPGGLPVGAVSLVDPVRNIIDASDDAGLPIEIEVASPHYFNTGDSVDIAGVVGNVAANGLGQTITVTSSTKFTLDGTSGTGTTPYVSDGTATNNTANDEAVLDLGTEAQIQWLATSTLVDGATAGGGDTGTGLGYVFFTGGLEGATPTFADYFNALAEIEEEDFQGVYVGTSDSATQAAAAAHCKEMSHPARKRERFLFCGAPLKANSSLEKEAAIDLAKLLQTDRAAVQGVSAKRTNALTGNLETLSPNRAAAILFGMAMGSGYDISLTQKAVKVEGFTYKYTANDYKDFVVNGVTVFYANSDDNLPRVYDDLTTWQSDANVYNRKRLGVGVRDFLTRKLRVVTSGFIGTTGDQTVVDSIYNAVDVALKTEIRSPQYPSGVLTRGRDGDPAYKGLSVEYDGVSTVTIRFEAHGVGEITYIHTLGKLTPTEIIAQAS